jgi:hypothetical protein
LVIGSEKDNLFESTIIPKYSMILAGLVIDFSEFIKKPRNSNISSVDFKSARAPSSKRPQIPSKA